MVIFSQFEGRFVELPGFDSKYAKSLIREFQIFAELEILRPPPSVFSIEDEDTLVLEGRGRSVKVPHPAWRVRVSSESGVFRYESEDYLCPGGDCGHAR